MSEVKKSLKSTPVARVARTSTMLALDPEILQKIDKGLEAQGIVIVRAPSMGGKTTIAREWHRMAVARKELVACIELRNEISLSVLNEKLSIALGFENDEAGFGEIFEEAAHQNITLIIDGVDRVKNAAVFLRDAVNALRADVSLRLVVTVEQIPVVDAMDLVEFRVLDYKGLDIPMIEQLLKVSGASIDGVCSEVAKKISELTNGNPSIIRLTISNAIQEGRPLSIENLVHSHSDIVGQFTRALLERAGDSNRSLLAELASVKYSSVVRDQVISQIQPSFRSVLEQAALLRKSLDGIWAVDEDFRNVLSTQFSEDELSRARDQILNRAKVIATPFGRAEEIWQFNQLGRLTESASILRSNGYSFLADFSPQVCLELSEPTWPMLEPEAYRMRQAAHINLYCSRQSKFECEYRLINARTNREKLAFQIFCMKVRLLQGDYSQSIIGLDENVKVFSKEDFLYWDGKLVLARSLVFSNRQRSLDLRKELFDTIERNQNAKGFRRQVYLTLANFHERECRLTEAIGIWDLFVERARLDDNRSNMALASQARLSLIYDVGRVSESIEELPVVRNLLEQSGGEESVALLSETESVHLFDRGIVSRSFEIIQRVAELGHAGITSEGWIPNIGTTLAMAAAAIGRIELVEVLNNDYEAAIVEADIAPSPHIRQPIDILFAASKLSPAELGVYFERLRPNLQTGYRYYTLRSFLAAFEIMWQRGILLALPWLESEFLRGLDAMTIVWKVRFFNLAEEVLKSASIEFIPRIRVIRNFFAQFKLNLWIFRCDLLLFLCSSSNNEPIDFAAFDNFQSVQDRELLTIARDAQLAIGRLDLMASPISKAVVELVASKMSAALTADELRIGNDVDYVLNLENREFRGPNGITALRQRATAFNLIRVLAENSKRPLDKEALTKLVWNESYNPLVHDTRIYTSINRIRDLVPIESIEGAYKLKVKVSVIRQIE